MQLISLTSNKNSFKPVHFTNETGINIIVASQKNPHKSDKGDTTNGVGKSLLIAIIHFCLGSSNKKSFREQLPDWEFYLKFKIKEREYTSVRSTRNQGTIVLNGERFKRQDFVEKLQALTFNIPEDVSELSFRALLPFFIRPKRVSYHDEANPNGINRPVQVQMANALLLGLDVKLAEEKYRLRQEKERIKKLVVDLKEDGYLKDFFIGRKDVFLTKQELDETINNLEENLKEFQVADDYYDIKEKANRLKQKTENIQNELTLLEIKIENIEESRQISPDIKRDSIEKIYQEASVILKEDAVKQLSELERFYEFLAKNREKRLLEQRNEIELKIEELKKEKKEAHKQLDEKLQYLNAHQALDVFVKLSNQLADLKSKKNNLLEYEELFEKYRNESRRIKQAQISESERTEKYLKDASGLLSVTRDFFRALVKRFYPNAAAGITVANNEGDNQIRYDIKAKVEADKSDGIGSVKLFCYDLTLLLKGFNHKIGFLFHDSRLLDAIDPRQIHELFLILREYLVPQSKQYIITVNENQLKAIKPYFTSDNSYAEIIEDNIVLKLKDNAPEEKLLGVQVDMDYD